MCLYLLVTIPRLKLLVIARESLPGAVGITHFGKTEVTNCSTMGCVHQQRMDIIGQCSVCVSFLI